MTAYEKGLYKINEETDKYILKLNDVDKDGNLKMKQSDIDLLTEEAYRWQDVSIAIAENTHIREQDALGVKTATKAEDEYRAAHEALHPSLQGTINAIHEKEVAEQKSVIALNLDNNELTNAIILQIKHTAQLQIERAEIEATSKAYGDLSTVLGGIGDLVGGKGGGLLSGLGGLSGALKGIGGTKGISNTIGDMFSNGADEEGMGGSTMKFAMNFVGGIAKFMPIAGAAVGLATSVISMFHKPEFEKIAKELGKELGTDISDETAKAIEATEKKLNVSRAMAEALNVDKIIGEAGLSDKTFAMVGDLMKGIADGSIPAAEGMDELDKAFQKVSESSPAAAIAMMKQAKVLGEELTPAMQKYLDVQHKLMAEGADEIGKGLALSGAETFGSQFGTDAAQFFVMGFAEEIAQNGLLSALDSQKDNINKMFDEFQKAGNEDAMALLQPYKNLEDVINGADTALKGTLTTFSGMEKVFQGLSKAGDLTLSNFQAMERSISKVNDDLTKQGITGDASMQIQHQALQDIIDAHNTYGYVIDENTQKLIDQEIAAGHAFKTDPIVGLTQALNDLIVTLGGVPSAINAVSNSIDNMHTTPGGGVDTGGHNSGAPTSDYNNYAQQQQQAHQFHAASGMDMVLGYGPLPGGASGILAHPGEHVQITPAGQSRTSDTSITFAPVININGSGLSKAEVLQMVDKDIKDNVFGLQTRIKRVMEGRY
jgi:hypothetical protein